MPMFRHVHTFSGHGGGAAAALANIAICLIHQTHYLLDRQLLRLEKDFLEQGGLRERMTRARLHRRQGSP